MCNIARLFRISNFSNREIISALFQIKYELDSAILRASNLSAATFHFDVNDCVSRISMAKGTFPFLIGTCVRAHVHAYTRI